MHRKVIIVDFGSQYTYLIATRIRELNVYCEIITPFELCESVVNDIKSKHHIVVLSGGPQSVFNDDYKSVYPYILSILKDTDIPVLGICFGFQLIVHLLGGKVEKCGTSEYGKTELFTNNHYFLHPMLRWLYPIKNKATPTFKDSFKNSKSTQVWMSHSDKAVKLPDDFVKLGWTKDCEYAFITCHTLKVFGLQFHPEVKHTIHGKDILSAFLFGVCEMEKNWNSINVLQDCEHIVKTCVKEDEHVILGLSGGVDSMVSAALLRKVIGYEKVHCVLIDHGMMRLNEVEDVKNACKESNIDLYVYTSDKFIDRLNHIEDPEEKRKIIGHTFIESFVDVVDNVLRPLYQDVTFLLGQGTIYPDVVESAKSLNSSSHSSSQSQQHVIKSHHNVGGLPAKLGFKLVEPLRHLFKYDVRELGKILNVPKDILDRHPFPGPGLGIRILGEVTKEKLDTVRKADAIFINAIKEAGLYNSISQCYAALCDKRSVGVVGDVRRYGYMIILRAVCTQDFMTANVYPFDMTFLEDVSSRIVNNIDNVSRVLYDTTSKPPSTIELE